MTFSSVLFLHVFFAALLCCYFAPFVRRRNTKNVILLLFSLAFYACGGLAYFPLTVHVVTRHAACRRKSGHILPDNVTLCKGDVK
jgi:alginate O-acetyltransferase complex protein AlgI